MCIFDDGAVAQRRFAGDEQIDLLAIGVGGVSRLKWRCNRALATMRSVFGSR